MLSTDELSAMRTVLNASLPDSGTIQRVRCVARYGG